uniref:Uncharacterized protein n=1 Tax=viral metagenome TaxID=1070528 RepID=A0A6C0DA92_9ZZZZ
MLLKDFLYNLLAKYDKTCIDFLLFYKKLYNNIGLYSFYQLAFVLNI